MTDNNSDSIGRDLGAIPGSCPTGQAQLHGPDATRFDPARKCECEYEGRLDPARAGEYDAELELPYVNHAPGECRCTNDLAQYTADGGAVRWLCSCCHTFADERLAIATETQRAETTEIGSVEDEGAGRLRHRTTTADTATQPTGEGSQS